MELLERSLVDVADAVRKGQVSALDLAEAAIARIERDDTGSHLDFDPARTRAMARAVDEKRARGQALGALAGVPLGLKDVLCTKDARTTCASKILDGYRPPYDATAVARLRAADAVFTGKLNMDEFAMGSSNENSAYGVVKNPWDPTRVPGGSSGGSAAAVAAGLALGTLGTDTGGSIRQPAALCGVVGVKPTYGRVSRYGLVAFASSLDQIGTFAADVRGAARLLEVIAGHDPRDSTSVARPIDEWVAACGTDVAGLRLGVPREYFEEGLDADVRASIGAAIESLRGLGCTIVPVEMPHTKYAVATYYVVATAECSSNLARFDGVRYATRVDSKDLESMYGETRDRGFGAEVKRRILLGTYVLSAGYYDAYYSKAQKVRTLIRRDFDRAFEQVDAIVGPTSPSVAWPLGAKVADPLQMYLADVYTLPASLAGLPGVSVPAQPGASGLPIGLQIVTPAWSEARMFSLAHAFEQVSPAKGLRPRRA
ncbi:MAG: Asp-tRNA(Asn)/Glu-tRNA(Gln) amidotransferase subunit GatA [Deltaproteobacteria bacterium]|nr:Asp-tRNA(Asn)/Glu-tRNA(Gln) amidotransferase subunit GatA [Deltaproteobacteria bacterium]